MEIILDNIMPEPLASISHQKESIWSNFTKIDGTKKNLLNATSGKGKSTFTFLLAGLRNDYSGNIFFDQRNIRDFSAEDWAVIRQTKLSFVFQDLQLFPNLTVKENLLIKNQLQQTFSEENLKSFLDALDIVHKWDEPCKFLSMGQQQRVAIIRSLCQPFEVLIMDEPFSHLDEANAQKCLQLITQRCDELGAGFILTTLGDTYRYPFDNELKL